MDDRIGGDGGDGRGVAGDAAGAGAGAGGAVAGGREGRKKRVVGYLKGRGDGATWSPDGSLKDLREEAVEIRRRLDVLIEDLEEAEQAFVAVRRAFDRTQPPIFNRFQVRWWKLWGGGPRVPCLVIVAGTQRGDEKPTRVKDRRTKPRKDSGFALNHDLNLRVIDTYWALWSLREEARDRWTRVAKAFAGMRPVAEVVRARVAELEQIREQATERLRLVGYEYRDSPADDVEEEVI